MSREKCKHCAYCDLKNCRKYNNTYYCKEHGWYVDLNSDSCRQFQFDPQKRNLYLATKVINILGMSENSDIYILIRDFRDALEQDPYYEGMLSMYDIFAPVLAEKLDKDNFQTINSEIILIEFLEPAMDLYMEGKIDEAVDLFQDMVTSLMTMYQVDWSNVKEKDGYIFDKLGAQDVIPTINESGENAFEAYTIEREENKALRRVRVNKHKFD